VKRQTILYVEWVDSMNSPGWRRSDDLDDASRPARCCSVGFVVRDTRDALTLALNHCRDEGTSPYADLMTIPRVANRRRVVLQHLHPTKEAP
jgi:hypothetical protein